MDIFLTKRMDLLQEAFIHAPELCEAHFTTDVRALFDDLLNRNTCPLQW